MLKIFIGIIGICFGCFLKDFIWQWWEYKKATTFTLPFKTDLLIGQKIYSFSPTGNSIRKIIKKIDDYTYLAKTIKTYPPSSGSGFMSPGIADRWDCQLDNDRK